MLAQLRLISTSPFGASGRVVADIADNQRIAEANILEIGKLQVTI